MLLLDEMYSFLEILIFLALLIDSCEVRKIWTVLSKSITELDKTRGFVIRLKNV